MNRKQIILTILALFISINAMAETTVYKIKSTVYNGETISSSDIIAEVLNRKNIPDSYVLNKDDIIGMQALRNLRPGTIIRDSFIRVKPMVSENTAIKIVYKAPGLNLESKVKALQDGNKGEIIKVLNLTSKKEIFAEVIGSDLVSANQ